jgi:hypothetical protein
MHVPGSVCVQIPLVDFADPNMGVLQFCERSHARIEMRARQQTIANCAKDESTVLTPAVELGSIILYDTSVVHRSKAHDSTKDRLALYIVYHDGHARADYDDNTPRMLRELETFREEYARLAEEEEAADGGAGSRKKEEVGGGKGGNGGKKKRRKKIKKKSNRNMQ